MHSILSKHENYKNTFVTHSDIRKIPDFKDETILAIKAPPGTKMDIPTNGLSTRYQILITSQKEPIDVYVVPDVSQNPPSVLATLPDPLRLPTYPALSRHVTISSSNTLTESTTTTLNNSVIVDESMDQTASVGTAGKGDYSLLQNEEDDYHFTLCQPSEGIADFYMVQDWND